MQSWIFSIITPAFVSHDPSEIILDPHLLLKKQYLFEMEFFL